jgi:hypothetical protein
VEGRVPWLTRPGGRQGQGLVLGAGGQFNLLSSIPLGATSNEFNRKRQFRRFSSLLVSDKHPAKTRNRPIAWQYAWQYFFGSRSLHGHALMRAQLRISVTSGWLTFFTRAWAVFPPAVVKGRPVTSHSPLSLTSRSPTRSCIGRTLMTADSLFPGRCLATLVRPFVYLASDRRTACTRQPDVIILNSAVEIAAVLVLLQEGDQGAEESRHLAREFPEACPHERAGECTAGAGRSAFVRHRLRAHRTGPGVRARGLRVRCSPEHRPIASDSISSADTRAKRSQGAAYVIPTGRPTPAADCAVSHARLPIFVSPGVDDAVGQVLGPIGLSRKCACRCPIASR